MSDQIPRFTRVVAWTSNAILKWQRERVAEAGGDPTSIKDEPFRFMRLPEVIDRTGLARSTIYRRMASQTFPRQIPLGS